MIMHKTVFLDLVGKNNFPAPCSKSITSTTNTRFYTNYVSPNDINLGTSLKIITIKDDETLRRHLIFY